MAVTLQELRYVVALADHGHFGRAATSCGVGQSTLSMQIKKLETQLGVALFERTTQAVSMTASGAEVAARARQILADVEALALVGQVQAEPLSGPFSLGVIPTLGPYLLPWLVPALKRRFPALRLAVREDLTAALLDSLGSHRLDAALVALPLADERLDALPLFDEPFWFAEPKTRRSDDGQVMTEADLRGRSLLLLNEGHCLRDQALAICGTGEADASADFRATSLETILQMVATGMGSTLLPALACGHAKTRAVTTRPLAEGLGRRIGLVWRRSFPRQRDLAMLAEVVRTHLPAQVQRCD